MKTRLKNTKVLLVQPSYMHQRETGAWGINPPMGLAYIAAVLEANQIDVEIIDANALDLSPEEVVEYAIKANSTIVGVSIMTPAHNFSVRIAQKLPEEILSVAGGPHAASIPEDVLREGFRVVVRGEGEYTMLELAQGKELSSILGISFKNKNGEIVHNPSRPPLDSNNLPLPARHLLINNGVDKPYFSAGTRYFPWARIITSRGCPYNCYYCNKLIFGWKFRARSPENVVKEIVELVKKYGVKEISISDDCFNFDLERAEKILDLMISEKLNIHLRFSNGLRADKVTKTFLKKAKKAGCDYIAYGIESGDQEILDKIPKAIKIETIKKAVELTKKEGIHVTGFFMLGLIGDTEESMQKTINFAKELDLDVAQFTMTLPYPGTRMWNMIKESGGDIYLKNWDDFHHTTGEMLFSMPGMASPEVVEMMYKKAHKEYYFRLGYIIKQLPKLISIGQIKIVIRGVRAILYTQKKRGGLK